MARMVEEKDLKCHNITCSLFAAVNETSKACEASRYLMDLNGKISDEGIYEC